MSAGSGRRLSGEVCGSVGVTASLDLETVMHGQAAIAGPCQKPQAGLTKALPWQVGEGKSALIPQPGERPPHMGWAQLCKETEMKVEPSSCPKMPALQLREELWQAMKR